MNTQLYCYDINDGLHVIADIEQVNYVTFINRVETTLYVRIRDLDDALKDASVRYDNAQDREAEAEKPDHDKLTELKNKVDELRLELFETQMLGLMDNRNDWTMSEWITVCSYVTADPKCRMADRTTASRITRECVLVLRDQGDYEVHTG